MAPVGESVGRECVTGLGDRFTRHPRRSDPSDREEDGPQTATGRRTVMDSFVDWLVSVAPYRYKVQRANRANAAVPAGVFSRWKSAEVGRSCYSAA